MQCGTPSIISKQSGCGEILDKVIKTDYWDINAMADAIYSICTNPSLFQYLQEEGKKEVDGITWEKVCLLYTSMPNEKEGSLLYWLFKKRFEYSAFTTMSFIG